MAHEQDSRKSNGAPSPPAPEAHTEAVLGILNGTKSAADASFDAPSLRLWADRFRRALQAESPGGRITRLLLEPFAFLFGTRNSDETVGAPKAGEPRADFLRDEIRRLRRRRARTSHFARVYLTMGTLLLAGSLAYFFVTGKNEAWFVAAYAIPLIVTPLLRSSRSFDTDILALESELDLVEATAITSEQRAEKLFKNHQYELQKYYDQTLRHSKWIFAVGVACILLGFVTIGVTFFVVVRPPVATTIEEKILVGAIGAAGSILANFIAVIYLRMFSEILKSVTDFHNRLVATHNLYFANFMATKVGDGARDGIVSEIARNVTTNGAVAH